MSRNIKQTRSRYLLDNKVCPWCLIPQYAEAGRLGAYLWSWRVSQPQWALTVDSNDTGSSKRAWRHIFIVPSAIRLGGNVVYATPTFIINAKQSHLTCFASMLCLICSFFKGKKVKDTLILLQAVNVRKLGLSCLFPRWGIVKFVTSQHCFKHPCLQRAGQELCFNSYGRPGVPQLSSFHYCRSTYVHQQFVMHLPLQTEFNSSSSHNLLSQVRHVLFVLSVPSTQKETAVKGWFFKLLEEIKHFIIPNWRLMYNLFNMSLWEIFICNLY